MTASRRQRIAVVGLAQGASHRPAVGGPRLEVAVFEARDRVGGRMGGLQDGAYAWDTGPTILQLPRLYDDLFAQAGLQRADYIPFLPVEPYTRIQFWDHTHLDLTTNQTQLKAQLAAMRPDLPSGVRSLVCPAAASIRTGLRAIPGAARPPHARLHPPQRTPGGPGVSPLGNPLSAFLESVSRRAPGVRL
jgi:phytoene dehydrogenase-like protein